VTAPVAKPDPVVAVWLGSAPPVRSIRWLDGALEAAGKFPGATAVAAGDPTWLDLAADRASRLGLPSVGVPTDLQLDYLGWAQVMAGVARRLGATTILVDEASRPERFAEVAAIAELCDAAQLTHVVAITADAAAIHASRIAGTLLQTVRIHGPAVLGLRISGAPIDEYPTPTPSASMRRLDLAALGLDPVVLGHRALPPRASHEPRRSIERVAEHLAVHMAPRKAAPDGGNAGDAITRDVGASRRPRDGKATRSGSEAKDTREPRDPREPPGSEAKDARDPKDARDSKDARGAKGARGTKDA
jgi:hypothetical protein